MLAGHEKSSVLNSQSDSGAGFAQNNFASSRSNSRSPGKFAGRIPFKPSGKLFSPATPLIWILTLLGVGACVAPWIPRGWGWYEIGVACLILLASFDAWTLWRVRNECAPLLLLPEKGLRGGEGQVLEIPLALSGSGRRRFRADVLVAIMPATAESESAIRVMSEPQHLALQQSLEPLPAGGSHANLWPWSPKIALLRRGTWPAPRLGLERHSSLGIWRLRQWFESAESLRIDADLRSGRGEILRSPVYRSIVASLHTPWTGQGREFERLREYQPGDMYSEIAWKATARRSTPVTRMFQWEQKQEVYFVVDQSRASALLLDADNNSPLPQTRAPRRMLDLAVETALVGATVALELGDEFGLVTYAEEPKSWLQVGSGQAQFHQFRDHLLNVAPLPTTADYEALFREIRVRLRRRAYIVLLADLTERAVSNSLVRNISQVRSSHAFLITSILPAHARQAFSGPETPQSDSDVYAVLAGDKENQRLAALSRQMRQLNVQLRYVPQEAFLRTAVEGYMESKREQRL